MIYDRPYMRDAQPAPNSVIKILLVSNIAVFAFQVILGSNFPTDFFAASTKEWWMKPWTLVTYSFLHQTGVFPWHILGNLLGIFLIGRMLEQSLTQRQILTLYFGSVLAGSILWLGCNSTTWGTLKGASAGVSGFLIYFCLTRPNQPISLLLFFIIPVTLKPKWIGWTVFLVELYCLFALELGNSTEDSIGHSAHLGGMLGAVLFYRFGMGYKLSFSDFGNLATPFSRQAPQKSRRTRPLQPTGYSVNTHASRDHLQKEVDRILDKINEHGFGSLTTEEKKTLDQAKDVLKR